MYLKTMFLFYPVLMVFSSLFVRCYAETTLAATESPSKTSKAPRMTVFAHSTSAKPLAGTQAPSTTKENRPSTKENASITTKAYVSTERAILQQSKAFMSTKGPVKSARKPKLNISSSGARAGVASAERLGAVDCDLPLLPRESRLWRGNETHELNLPVTMTVNCVPSNAISSTGGDEDCPHTVMSWEGSEDIQSGDILIVRIDDTLLQNVSAIDTKNKTVNMNTSHTGTDTKPHTGAPDPAVYQVTRQGHEHCDVSDGMLLDITPLDEGRAKLITLYNKDLAEGVNLLIVVSENWGSQCVRLKVTVKSDNCGESQDCSGKGVCYTNVSMEGYECQCCPGSLGPHCEERDACNPSPCQNNGICVYLTQPLNGANYHCLCPYGFTGRNCEGDPCFSTPCRNGGSCMSAAVNGTMSFRCACAPGWGGVRCDRPATACASSPCLNGICVEQIDDGPGLPPYRCFCQPGYTGDMCEEEYNECESSPCANGGTCTDLVAGFRCACGRGYAGSTCQDKVDLCNPNPCPERRYCIDRGNHYACECPRGFSGEECTIVSRAICDNNPCAHGGTCWDGVDSFYCSCRPGYTGKLCEEDFILESVVGSEVVEGSMSGGGGGSVREVRLPLGLYHDRLHNVYIAAGTLGAAIAIVGLIVTACHCRVNKTYSRLLSRVSRPRAPAQPPHWLQDKCPPPARAPLPPPPPAPFDSTDMYYTLEFSDSQSSPLIQ